MVPIQTKVFSRVLKYADLPKPTTSKVVDAIYLFTQNVFVGFSVSHTGTQFKHKVRQECFFIQRQCAKRRVKNLCTMVPHSVLRQYGYRITNNLFQMLRSFRSKANKLVIYQLLCPFFTTKHQQIFFRINLNCALMITFSLPLLFQVPIHSCSISAKGLSDTPLIRSPGIPYLV